jgi:hypothetical protein
MFKVGSKFEIIIWQFKTANFKENPQKKTKKNSKTVLPNLSIRGVGSMDRPPDDILDLVADFSFRISLKTICKISVNMT